MCYEKSVLQYAEPIGIAYKFGYVLRLRLLEQQSSVIIYSVWRDEELFGNVLTIESPRQQVEHFKFTNSNIIPSYNLIHSCCASLKIHGCGVGFPSKVGIKC